MEKQMVNVTLTMTQAERKALKQLALDRDISASELVRNWIAESLGKREQEA